LKANAPFSEVLVLRQQLFWPLSFVQTEIDHELERRVR